MTDLTFDEMVERLRKAGCAVVPIQPSDGLLASMALRYDHAFFAPRQEINGMSYGGQTPESARAILLTMRQLHEEVVGTGFYRPDRECYYRSLLEAILNGGSDD